MSEILSRRPGTTVVAGLLAVVSACHDDGFVDATADLEAELELHAVLEEDEHAADLTDAEDAPRRDEGTRSFGDATMPLDLAAAAEPAKGGAWCNNIFTIEHHVPTSSGAVLHVIEKVSPAAVLRVPRRGLVMLPGTLVTGSMYDMTAEPTEAGPADASTLNALDRAAAQGWFAYAVTYEGYPGSSLPDDGASVTTARTLQQVGEVIELIRYGRFIPEVDLLGTSFGASLSVALGGTGGPIDPDHIGHVVVQALVHREVTPLFEAVFFSPEVQALLESAPGGYVPTSPEQYGLILANADPVAAALGFATFPDLYATGPTLEGFDLPVVDAGAGVAPLLQFWGDADPITPLSDVDTFQAEYGGPNELRVLPEAGHAPYIAQPDLREAFWAETFEFIDGPGFFLACQPDD